MRVAQRRMLQDVAPAHACPEVNAVDADLDGIQSRDAADVDQHRRLSQPERQHRHQALATGERARIATVQFEQVEGFGEGRRGCVFEGRKLHARPDTAFAPGGAAGRVMGSTSILQV
jgi:hypothetical protein